MMKKHSLNHLGLWLLPVLSRRDIQLREFAHLLGTTSQGLSDLLRGQRFSSHTLAQWQLRFQEKLDEIDQASLSPVGPCRIHYQVVCFCIKNTSADTYYTYGLQCLCKLSGQWIQLDMIQDISLCGDDVFSLASRFNTLQLSPLHFRDAVLDSVS